MTESYGMPLLEQHQSGLDWQSHVSCEVRRSRRLSDFQSPAVVGWTPSAIDQKESNRRRYVDLPVSGLKLLSTRSLCCQLGPRNWQISCEVRDLGCQQCCSNRGLPYD